MGLIVRCGFRRRLSRLPAGVSRGVRRRSGWYVLHMPQLIIALLAIWLILSIIGFVVKGLVWLAIIGIILFLGTAAWGFIKRGTSGRR